MWWFVSAWVEGGKYLCKQCSQQYCTHRHINTHSHIVIFCTCDIWKSWTLRLNRALCAYKLLFHIFYASWVVHYEHWDCVHTLCHSFCMHAMTSCPTVSFNNIRMQTVFSKLPHIVLFLCILFCIRQNNKQQLGIIFRAESEATYELYCRWWLWGFRGSRSLCELWTK